MVDVTNKPATHRVAMAKCAVITPADTSVLLKNGDGFEHVEAARIAGIQGAKQTSSLVPLCHPTCIDRVSVDVVVVTPHRIEVTAVTEIVGRTGVEMEALTACAIAGLNLVASLVCLDPTASLEDLTLWHKSGGRSGDWERTGADAHFAPAGSVLLGGQCFY
jgi:cyclic pyranopterin phosphate synthase